ncbi:MAG TPA: nuclear transport factor 2 family protein [Gemmatimonadaceae bacterium]|jgi:ketosteroid isomerase-like protein
MQIRKTILITLGTLIALGILLIGNVLSSQVPVKSDSSRKSTADSVAIVRVASRFHTALEQGDTVTIRQLLAPDLSVLEAGMVETRAEYLAHHLAADIEFAKSVQSENRLTAYSREGAVAWLVSTSSAQGTFRGRRVDSLGAELMVLSKTRFSWQIRAIHWSSGRRGS